MTGFRCPLALVPTVLAVAALLAPPPTPHSSPGLRFVPGLGSLPRLGWAGPLAAQELRGWLVLDAESGHLSNAYLDPVFPTWDPAAEGAFVLLGATGTLELTGEASRLWLSGGARRTELLDGEQGWHGWLGRLGLEHRLARGVTGALEAALADLHRDGSRWTLWTRAEARWNVSPSVRLRAGPGVALRSLPAPASDDLADPPLIPPTPPTGREERAQATGYLLLAGIEARTGTRWRWDLEAFAARTEAEDLGLDYSGGGARARATRTFPGGARLELGGALEGFGYRAAVEGTPEAVGDVPANDLLWRTEAAVGLPVARSTELTARLSGLGIRDPDGAGERSFEWRAAAGVRFTLGSRLAGPERRQLWTRTADGLRLEVPYDGMGRLYVTGDFNSWAEPGDPLERGPDGRHVATLRVPSGSYRYGIRVLENGTERWLELPKGTPTADDGFGGENGLLVVDAAGAPRDPDQEDGR